MLLTAFLGLVALVLLVILPYYMMYTSRAARLLSNMPGPKPLPLIGNALELGTTTVDILKNIVRLCDTHGFTFRAWLGTYLCVVIGDPKYAEPVMSSNVNIKKSMNYHFFEPWLGTGLLTSKGSKWKHHRKILTPSFHFKILEDFMDVFSANGNILIQKLKENVDGPEFDLYQLITLYTLDVICEAAMGSQMNVQCSENNEYVSAVYGISEVIVKRNISPWLYPDFLFNMSSLGRKHKACVKILHNMSCKVIEERRKMLYQKEKKKEITLSEEHDVGQKKRLAFLDLLLLYNKDGGNLTLEEIREEVDTFMFEGHDTTASALTFCLWLLAENSVCQEKAHEELYDIFGDSDREPTTEDLPNMKYLECVIKETLRLYPSVPIYLRELDEDVKTDNVTFAAGTTIAIVPFVMHRHPEYFPDPDKFNPERFLIENVQGRNPYAYVPFSAGPRNCIGQKFAMMAMKSIISKLLRNFKITRASKELILSYELILRSYNGVYIKLESRK